MLPALLSELMVLCGIVRQALVSDGEKNTRSGFRASCVGMSRTGPTETQCDASKIKRYQGPAVASIAANQQEAGN